MMRGAKKVTTLRQCGKKHPFCHNGTSVPLGHTPREEKEDERRRQRSDDVSEVRRDGCAVQRSRAKDSGTRSPRPRPRPRPRPGGWRQTRSGTHLYPRFRDTSFQH